MSRKISGLVMAAALCTSLLAPVAANAAPILGASSFATAQNANVQTVDYRGYRGGYYRGGRGYGRGIGLGLGAAILGGALIAGAARSNAYGYYDGDYEDSYGYRGGGGGVARCAAAFKSFDPDSGTYTGYDGVRHTCPYL